MGGGFGPFKYIGYLYRGKKVGLLMSGQYKTRDDTPSTWREARFIGKY